MKQNDLAILKGLVSVAWADGQFVQEERDVIDAMLNAFAASPETTSQVRDYAKTERSLADVPVSELSAEDRRTLLQHAVLLAMMDGEFHETEADLIERLRVVLEIPDAEARVIFENAKKRAGQLRKLL